MKTFLIGLLAVIVIAGAGIAVFREPLKDMAYERIAADVFVAEDTDSYDPGVAVGALLPPLRALHDGDQVTDVRAFMGTKGVALFAIRSVDW